MDNEKYISIPSGVWTYIPEVDLDVTQDTGSNQSVIVFDSADGHKKITHLGYALAIRKHDVDG